MDEDMLVTSRMMTRRASGIRKRRPGICGGGGEDQIVGK
jgi:hypothetical protein